MSERAKGLIVTLTRDIRIGDDLQPLIASIKQLRGVADVAVSRSSVDDYMNRVRLRDDLQNKLHTAIDAAFDGGES
jgi:hypothetical protein